MRLLLNVAIIVAVTTGACAADPTSEADTQRQIAVHRAEVAKLREENSRLAKALADNGIVLTDGYQSAAGVLNKLPSHIRPAEGWDRFAIDKLAAWLKEKPIGEPFEAVLVPDRLGDRKAEAAGQPLGQAGISLPRRPSCLCLVDRFD